MSVSLEDRLAEFLVSTRDRDDSPQGVYRRLQLVARVMRAAPSAETEGSRLVWLNEHDEPQTLSLTNDALVSVGRDPRCEVPLTDPRASRRHALVRCVDGTCEITDQHSSNGTRLNSIPLEASRILKDGDVIEVGSTALVYFRGRDDESVR